MVRSRSWVALVLVSVLAGAGLFACKSKKAEAVDAGASLPAPAASSAPVAAPAPLAAPAIPPGPAPMASPKASKVKWPLWKYESITAGAKVGLPAEARVADLSVEPRGHYLAVLLERGPAQRELYLWDGRGALRPVADPSLAGRELTSIAHSPFTHALYVASGGGGTWRIDRFDANVLTGALTSGANVYKAQARIESVHIPLVRYAGFERLFFGQEHAAGRFQLLSTRTDGSQRYEVTSPTGQLGALTEEALRKRAAPGGEQNEQRPQVLRADSALPFAIEPHNGTLLAAQGESQLFALGYERNWGDARPLEAPGPGTRYLASPNGHYRFRWTPGRAGLEVVDPQGAVADTLAKDKVFASAPVLSPSGRTFVAAVADPTGSRLESFAVTTPLAAVRYLHELRADAATLAALAKSGLTHTRTTAANLHEPYESLRYDSCKSKVQVPIFASVDGFLEVLHAGFQAVFMLGEEHLSRPRLQAFLNVLESFAQKAGKERIVKIAAVAKKVLAGDLDHPEGALIRAEARARSELHTVNAEELDFQDFHPRGPYTATDALMSYFRAFKYINLLQLTPEEAVALRADSALVAAWKAWSEVQAPYLSGSRQETWFGGKSTLAPHLRADCIPDRIKKAGPLLFPLSWGLDSEIMESTVLRLGAAADCSVPERLLPSGVDLLAGLGSPEAAAVSSAAYAQWPALKKVHGSLRKRFARFAKKGFVNAWLGIVQRLSSTKFVPEGVNPSLWRRRLMQTALASWTSFKHTTVLVNASMGAECGDGFQGFEELRAEPVRGAVDPVPAAWKGIGALLRSLADHARKLDFKERDGLRKVLSQASARATAFGRMAARQKKGEPLTKEEYQAIQKFAGEVEHPFLLLKSAVSRRGPDADSGGMLVVPPPMTKIVDIHQGGPASFLHMAVGHPLAVQVLLGDRGILTPVSGAVYSYYEVVADKRLDDDEWRARLKSGNVPAPTWVPPVTEAAPSASGAEAAPSAEPAPKVRGKAGSKAGSKAGRKAGSEAGRKAGSQAGSKAGSQPDARPAPREAQDE